MKTKTLCDVYKSPRHDEMYLYVDRKDGLSRVPDELLARFGKPEKTLMFILSEDRRLATADPKKVLANLNEQGYHLQMPPLKGDPLGKYRAQREEAVKAGQTEPK